MPKIPPRQWDSSILANSSRAWFVTKWPGNYAGAPNTDILFVIEIPRASCLCIQLFSNSSSGWEHNALSNLAVKYPSPDRLITDDTRLQHVLVSVGSSFQNTAAAYLHRPITLMPAISQCINSLMAILNQSSFQAQSAVEKINAALELWRVGYNDRDATGTL